MKCHSLSDHETWLNGLSLISLLGSGVKSRMSLSDEWFGDISWPIGTVEQSEVANKRFEDGT